MKKAKPVPLLDDSLQLGGAHQQCNVQHARCALLVGIMVHVDGLVPAPAARLQGVGWSGQALQQDCRPGPPGVPYFEPGLLPRGPGKKVGVDRVSR